MKRIPLSLFTFLFLLSGLCAAPTKTVWQIGEKNHSASELALSPDKYKEFLANDFGWEDRFYIIGLSSPQKDFPYVLPGPADHWGGTSYTAGIRTHVLNILFGMKEVPETSQRKWKINRRWLFTNQTAYDRNSSELRSDQKRKQLHRAYKSRRFMDSLRWYQTYGAG